jgi:hypothetical protein
MRETTVANAPYSAMEVTTRTQTLADGTQITHTQQTQVTRDSQGRVRTETTHTPPAGSTAQARTTVEIFDPVERSVTRLDPQRATAEKNMLPAGRAGGPGPRGRQGGGGNAQPNARANNANSAQVQSLDLGTKMVGGVSGTGTRTTRTIPAGAEGNTKAIVSTREVWKSAELQVPLMETSTDPRFGTTTRQLNNVTRSEPDPSLFAVPSNYKVTTHTRPAGRPAPQQ